MTLYQRTAAALAAALIFSVSVAAQWPSYPTPGVPRQDGKPVLDGPPPRTPEGKVDLSGIWQLGGFGGGGRGRGAAAAQPQTPPDPNAIPNSGFGEVAGRGFALPLQPWAAALKKERMSDNMKDNPDVWCLPIGIMQYHNHPQPRQIVQTKNLTLITYESNYGLRYIYTDGRPAPNNDPTPWWFGYSRGWWEGDDTLVVETTNFLGDERAGWLDVNGSPYTDALKLTERFRRPTFGTLQIDVTIDDPKAYTKPFTVRVNHRLLVDQEMIEFICNENERSTNHLNPPAWMKGEPPRQLGPDMPLRTPLK
ncbi:MAG TPA: hypothetical protein VFO58_02765 [Vicinamibacterales bacterium]|nr:hypothetical protein [Vicinamibacterales bacterium]